VGLRYDLVGALVLAVALVVWWVHAPGSDSTAIWLDDQQYVTENALVLSPSWASAARVVSEVRHPSTGDGYYQPLAMLSLMLDSATGGASDLLQPFRETALLLHVLNTMLIIVLLVLLFGEPYPAALVGLLFGVHPLTVEPTVWLAERKTLLASCFALASLIAYVSYARTQASGDDGTPRPSRRRSGGIWYAASLAGYGLALGSNPTAVTLPVLFVLLDYWPLRRLQRRVLVEKVPFVGLGLVAALLMLAAPRRASDAQPLRDLVLTACHNIGFYLSKAIWPAHLSAYYPYPDSLSLSDPPLLAGVIGTAVLIAIVAVSLRWTRALFTGCLIFLVALLPIGLIRFTNTIASDTHAYLPALGFLIVLAWLLARAWSLGRGAGTGGRALQAAIAVVVLGLATAEAVATRRYLRVWESSETLYTSVLVAAPQASALQYNFAGILASQGRMAEAVDHYRQFVAMQPDDADAQQNLGNALFSLGQAEEAVGHYRRALELQPGNLAAMNNLGLAFAQLGRTDEAVAQYRRVLRFDPSHVAANNEVGLALVRQGEAEQAIAYFRAATQATPDFVEAHVNLADTLQSLGRRDEAIAEYRMALQLHPNDPAVHNNFAVVLTDAGLLDEAIAHYREALRLDPTLHDVESNLRVVQARRDSMGSSAGR
jgi:protein O-mannosyl-transferase